MPLPTHKATQRKNKRMQAATFRVGFEPAAPAFERKKTVHALDRAVTVIGFILLRIANTVESRMLGCAGHDWEDKKRIQTVGGEAF
jgi:hypothetical protein